MLGNSFQSGIEFEGKARVNPIGAPFLGQLLMLPANDRLVWKVIARYKHSSLLGFIISNEGKKFYNIDTRWMPPAMVCGIKRLAKYDSKFGTGATKSVFVADDLPVDPVVATGSAFTG